MDRWQTGIIKKSVSTKVVVTELGLEGDDIVDTSVHGGLDQALYLFTARKIMTGGRSAWGRRFRREFLARI